MRLCAGADRRQFLRGRLGPSAHESPGVRVRIQRDCSDAVWRAHRRVASGAQAEEEVMFIVYAKCRTCGNEDSIASFDNERDAVAYVAEQAQKRKDFGLRIEDE